MYQEEDKVGQGKQKKERVELVDDIISVSQSTRTAQNRLEREE
jgi:orotate phosphoribosyltransferase